MGSGDDLGDIRQTTVGLPSVFITGIEHRYLVQLAVILAHVARAYFGPDHRLDDGFLTIGVIFGKLTQTFERGFFESSEGPLLDAISKDRDQHFAPKLCTRRALEQILP